MLQFLFIYIINILSVIIIILINFLLCIHVCVCVDYYLLFCAENLDDATKGNASSFAIHAMVFFWGSMKFSCLRAVTRMPVWLPCNL